MSIVKIFSAFPGTGKTTLYNNCKEREDLIVLDSDSSVWPKDNFPTNYVDHLVQVIDDYRNDGSDQTVILLVSSHKEVREELDKRGFWFITVIPDRKLKEEYLERYRNRGSSENFIKLLNDNWDNFLDSIENSEDYIVHLESGHGLSDMLLKE